MGIRKQIIDASSTGSGANANRASAAAEKRMGVVEGAVAGSIEDILMRPEVLGLLPLELGARVKVRDKAAMFEAMLLLQKMKSAPPTPANQMFSVPPDLREAGFQMGKNGGRVPTASAGEMIVAPPRGILRNPGSEAGFQMGGGIPGQDFGRYSTDLTVQNRGLVPSPGGGDAMDIIVRTPQGGRRDGRNPLVPAGAGIGTFIGAKLLYDQFNRNGDVMPSSEERLPQTSEGDSLPATPPSGANEYTEAADRLLDKRFGGRRMAPPRPESELWATSGERSMDYELRPGTPQANTRDALLDAGVEPGRAEGIARGIVSMTQMEHDAVIGNTDARRQRLQDGIQQRRNQRMGSYR